MAKNLADLTGARATKHSNGNGHGKAKGLRFNRFFTPPGSHAYDLVEWERRTASITGEKGQVIFEQKDVEVPRSWSQLAINVVAQKYFRGSPGSPERETSVRQIIDRVVETIANWGRQGGYFATEDDAANWAEELRFLLVTQHASFNSPVWFNIGIPSRSQQASACFINSVQDSMESILDLAKTEGMLFKFGSGTGTNLSVLRSSKEQLSGGGTASGPVSFMKGYDSFAGSIKSGGTTRRAAKMVILNADHPDVVDFIHSKAEEEKKAWALIEAGYNAGSECVILDATARTLLSLTLMKFQTAQGTFDVERLQRAVAVCFTGQAILVSNASYPTQAIGKNSEALRPLGLGYANIGALLMSMGLAYDSDEGRRFAGAITAIMTGRAFAQSARMAQVKGPFSEYAKNREPMLSVMEKHRQAAHQLPTSPESAEVVDAARETWDDAGKLGRLHGYRNAQATVLAPTGTIGLMMDCDTTGIEPDLALVKYKKLVGGGLLKIVNGTVPAALRKLGYDSKEVKDIVEYIDENDTIEGAPLLQEDHLKVFDCAFKPVKGMRSIAPMGHVRMMAAVQPFISGSMSKTVNLPTEATIEDIQQTYLESWKLGLKCIAIYRDGCKRSQPLSTSLAKEKKTVEPAGPDYRAVRRRLSDERKSITHKFDIQGHEGYLTVGMFEDGQPGELFVTMAKEGSTISGLMDAFATQTSYALQFGVPLKFMVDKFSHMRFEPSGFTKNKEIPIAKSIVDYIFRWMASHFLPVEDQDEAGVIRRDDAPAPIAGRAQGAPSENPKPVTTEFKVIAAPSNIQKLAFVNTGDAPACADCGAITVRSGSCYKCLNCGATTGCS